MTLHTTQSGHGPDLVLLHGWGMHAGIWQDIAQALAQHFRVTLIDLPGHGSSPLPRNMFDLDSVIEQLSDAAPPHAAWLGWSLGGMIATQLAARYPQRVSKLILTASSPRFVTAPDWPHAMEPAVLEGFASALQADYNTTLDRFLSLQVTPGTVHARETLRRLRAIAATQHAPQTAALRGGLDILRNADLRTLFGALACPVLTLFGARDRLVPPKVGADMQTLLPAAHNFVFEDAAHAPFLSHPEVFLTLVTRFLQS